MRKKCRVADAAFMQPAQQNFYKCVTRNSRGNDKWRQEAVLTLGPRLIERAEIGYPKSFRTQLECAQWLQRIFPPLSHPRR